MTLLRLFRTAKCLKPLGHIRIIIIRALCTGIKAESDQGTANGVVGS